MAPNRVADKSGVAKKLEFLKIFTQLRAIIKRDHSNDAVEGSSGDVAVAKSASDDADSATTTKVSPTSTKVSVTDTKVALINDEVSVTSTKVSVTKAKMPVSAHAKIMPKLPVEIIAEIGSYLDMRDIKKMRLVCKQFRYATNIIFGKALVTNRTLYPTYASVSHFLNMLLSDRDWAPLVQTITLVSDAPRVNEHGASWAWDVMEGQHAFNPNTKDRAVKHFLNAEHKMFCRDNDFFITTGGYRTLLTMIFSHLTNLHTVKVRRIRKAEHIPEFKATVALKDLSYYREDMDTRLVFYGDWQYDTLHRRVTTWVDEYGEQIIPDESGPQVGFSQDIAAALGYTCREVIVEIVA
ncbi:uncharacterized protein yc1106_02827 [Curvularia clavata]|uniref:F-box domain-containing protein n=1 Tax=Curvularia clavata TaxID=95742 RepID=A0A9Q8Z768_CURCL|nr:uncharacterized protein yc1106_02827 [Curvularia clavata]